MANDLQSPPESDQNLSTLVTGILNDAQLLFRQQVDMVRHEVREDLRKTKEAAVPLAIGTYLALLGVALLSVTVALMLDKFTDLEAWSSFAIVGVVVALAGGGLFYAGKQKFASFNPLPDESAKALQENLEWKTKPK
jgi:protein-S-isoprenylcysteine O-methyltransferase Ste14